MTVQLVNAVSMSFMSGSQSKVSFSTENSFDRFLVKDASDTTSQTDTNKDVSAFEKQPEKVDETDSMKSCSTASKPETVDAAKEDLTVEDNMSQDNSSDKKLPEHVLAEILSVLTQIVSVLQDNLQIDNQELLSVTEQLQFAPQDFFDFDRIKDLFLQVNDVDVSSLLTDENLYTALEQLQDMLSDVVENSNLAGLLQQEGIDAETFDLSLFQDEVSAYIMKNQSESPAAELPVKDLVIDFEPVQTERTEADPMFAVKSDAAVMDEVISANTDADAGNDSNGFFEADRGYEQASMFLQKLVSSVKADTEVIVNGNNPVDLYDIATQIIEQVKLHIRPENTRMEIQLNPEHLGKVELEITSSNGELSARLNVQSDHVKEAIESQMQTLRETLEVQGIKVETIEVTVAEFGFRFQDEQGNAEQFRQRQQRRVFVDGEETVAEDDAFSDVANVMKELNGNSVDYVA